MFMLCYLKSRKSPISTDWKWKYLAFRTAHVWVVFARRFVVRKIKTAEDSLQSQNYRIFRHSLSSPLPVFASIILLCISLPPPPPVFWMLSNRLDSVLHSQSGRNSLCLLIYWIFTSLSVLVGVSIFLPWQHHASRHPSDFRTQWETQRGRGNSFNLTTEPVSLLLLPVREFTHFT